MKPIIHGLEIFLTMKKTATQFLGVLLLSLPFYSNANDSTLADTPVEETNNIAAELENNFSEIESSESIELTLESTPELTLELESEAFPQQETVKPSLTQRVMPVYGNWCGANHPKDMSLADEPIDLLDQSCKKHDFCYENEGYLSCACDNEINQELILGLNENKYGKTEAVFARSFHLYFNGSPCTGDHSTKVAPSRFVHNVVKKASDRTVEVITSLPVIGDKFEEKLSD